MNLFHDEETGPQEPTPGLPEALPEGERVLWQGKPSAKALAIHAFHIRFVAAYFVVATGWRLASMASNGAPLADLTGVVLTALVTCLAAFALIFAIAWAMARAAIFTVTDARIVMRYGSAIRKYVNLPFASITSADVRRYGRRAGDISITAGGPGGVGYIHLWPFARPLKFARPQPTLRGITDVARAAETLKSAMLAAAPQTTQSLTALDVARTEASETAAKPARPAPTYVRIPAQRGAA